MVMSQALRGVAKGCSSGEQLMLVTADDSQLDVSSMSEQRRRCREVCGSQDPSIMACRQICRCTLQVQGSAMSGATAVFRILLHTSSLTATYCCQVPLPTLEGQGAATTRWSTRKQVAPAPFSLTTPTPATSAVR